MRRAVFGPLDFGVETEISEKSAMVVLLRVCGGVDNTAQPVVYLPIGEKRAVRDCTNPSKSLLRERDRH